MELGGPRSGDAAVLQRRRLLRPVGRERAGLGAGRDRLPDALVQPTLADPHLCDRGGDAGLYAAPDADRVRRLPTRPRALAAADQAGHHLLVRAAGLAGAL